MFDLLEKLVSFPTITSDSVANNAALDFIEDYLAARGMFVKRYQWEGHPSLVATIRPNQKRCKLLLGGHIDVVPGPDELFSLRKAHSKLYARGVFDMKFAIAAYLQIVDELQGKLDDYDFAIMITSDEEYGGRQGVGRLIEQGYRAKTCLLPDSAENWQIETLCKGYFWLEIIARGTAAHGSRPWEGENAAMALLKIIEETYTFFPEQDHQKKTLSLTGLQSGSAYNQIPDTASATIDFRFADPQEGAYILDQLTALCGAHSASLRILQRLPAHVVDFNHPDVKIFRKLVQQKTGRICNETMAHGSSDAPYLQEAGTTCILSSPEGGERHGLGEWLSEQGFFDFKEIACAYLEQMARLPVKKSTKLYTK